MRNTSVVYQRDIEESEVAQIYQSEVRVFFRLPCADVDHRFFRVVQVYHQEQIPCITVAGREIILLDLDTVNFTSYTRLANLVVGKAEVDEFRATEDVL